MSMIERSASFQKTLSLVAQSVDDEPKRLKDHIFAYDADACARLTQDVQNESLAFSRLAEMGGVQGLALMLRTSLRYGLYHDEVEEAEKNDRVYEKRGELYGRNVYLKLPPVAFWRLCLNELKDPMLIILMVAGVVSLIAGAIQHPEDGWIEGVAILIAVAVVTLVSAGNNWQKDKQFRALEEKEEPTAYVRREYTKGKADSRDILASEVQCGDIVILRTGTNIPCDGVLISGTQDLHIEEAGLTGESKSIAKDFAHPFFYSGTKVVEGEGIMLATCVGARTMWGALQARLGDERPDTPLQIKLEQMAKFIGIGGGVAAVILFLTLLGRWIYSIETDDTLEYADDLQGLLTAFIVAVTIVVVAVPEGLPLAVTISLAYSMKKMLADQNLVKHLSACETMGNVTTICSDKTGTLTTNKMTVVNCWLAGTHYDKQSDMPKRRGLSADVSTKLLQGLALNGTVVEKPPEQWTRADTAEYTGGNETEIALFRWAISLDCDYEKIRDTYHHAKTYPFSSKVKRSSVLLKYGKTHRMYLKGAAETVIGLCTKTLDSNGNVVEMTEDIRAKLNKAVDSMVSSGLRCIGMTYRDYDNIEYTNDVDPVPIDPEFEEYVCIGVAGIEDPVREEVPAAVQKCRNAGIVVRMVTGDHLKTAINIAKKCGILKPDYTENGEEVALTGPVFREMSIEQMEDMLPRMRVLARSTPADKERLVQFLIRSGQFADVGKGKKDEDGRKSVGDVVSVTGDGANDALALKEAHVGLAMGIQGTDIAKEAADIVIMDDNFKSIVSTVKWGRSVYDNIRKFVQFQLTVNVVALTISLIAAFAGFEVPLTAVQLLWVNLIMDTLAALAFGTEVPTEELLDRKPYRPDVGLISPLMWRQIFGQSAAQLIILFLLILPTDRPVGADIFDLDDTPAEGDIEENEKRNEILRTCLFNTFVWMQIWNMFIARKVNGEFNKLKNVFDNYWFSAIFVFIVCLQILMVEAFGPFADTVPLSAQQWGVCIALALIVVPSGLLLHLIPVNTKYGQIRLDEDKDDDSENESQYLLPVAQNGTTTKSTESPKPSVELEPVEKKEEEN